MRNIQLICQSGKQIVEIALSHHRHVEVPFWNLEMCPSWVAYHSHSQSFIGSTKFVLVKSATIVQPKDAITIMIQQFWSSFSSRVDILLHLVAVRTSPVVPSESRHIWVGIIVKIKSREVSISEVIFEKMDQPFPRWRRWRGGNWVYVDIVFFGFSVKNFAVFILAYSQSQTNLVWRLFIVQSLNDDWASKMDESLTGRFQILIKHRTELFIDKISHIEFMVVDIVIDYSQNNYAEGTLILKTTLNITLNLSKIWISAYLLEFLHMVHHELKILLPTCRICYLYHILQRLETIWIALWK